MSEYDNLVKSLPIKWELKPNSVDYELEHTGLNLRALLIRKYVVKPGKRASEYSVWIKDVLSSAERIVPSHAERIADIRCRYEQAYNGGEYALSSGTVLKMNELFEDIIYGTYLHSDANRMERLLTMDKTMMHQALRQFIHPIEEALYDLVSLVQELSITETFEQQVLHGVASTITTSAVSKESQKNLSGYWSNLYGHKAEDEEAIDNFFTCKSDQDKQILATALRFWTVVSDPKPEVSDLKDLVLNLSDWGDLSEVKDMTQDTHNLGIGSIVNYNHRNDVAYVKLLKHVDDAILITEEQIIPGVTFITLVEDPADGKWRVFSFGGIKEPYLDRS